jgi:tetrahydromethanopterin S-methyltransferase subunit G
MQRIIAVILIGLLITQPAYAGQKQGKPIDWQKAQQLKGGTEVVLTVTGGQPTKVRLLFADEATLVTLNPTAPKLPGGVKNALFSIGPKWSGILNEGLRQTVDQVRVSRDGIFDRDKKLADLADVVRQTPRGDVQEIAEPPHSHIGRNILIGLGVVVGVLILVVGFATGWSSN